MWVHTTRKAYEFMESVYPWITCWVLKWPSDFQGARSLLQAPVGIRSGASIRCQRLCGRRCWVPSSPLTWAFTPDSQQDQMMHALSTWPRLLSKLEYHCCMMWGCFRCITVWISQGRHESPPPRARSPSPASHPHASLHSSWAPAYQQFPASSLFTHGGVCVSTFNLLICP